MITRKITRTLTMSTIYASEVKMIDNVATIIELAPIELLGKVTQKEAMRVVRQSVGNKNVYINRIDYIEETFECNVEDFLEIANKVEKKEVKENE